MPNGEHSSWVEKQLANKTSGTVYFIVAGDFVKIGSSLNPEKRRSELQSHCPLLMYLMATEPGGRKREKELHAQFKQYRNKYAREWFAFNGEVREYVAQLMGASK